MKFIKNNWFGIGIIISLCYILVLIGDGHVENEMQIQENVKLYHKQNKGELKCN